MSELADLSSLSTELGITDRKRLKSVSRIAICVDSGIKCPDYEDGGIAVKTGFWARRETTHEPEDYALAAQKLAKAGIRMEVYRYTTSQPRLTIFGQDLFPVQVDHDWVKVIRAGERPLEAHDTSAYEQMRLYP